MDNVSTGAFGLFSDIENRWLSNPYGEILAWYGYRTALVNTDAAVKDAYFRGYDNVYSHHYTIKRIYRNAVSNN